MGMTLRMSEEEYEAAQKGARKPATHVEVPPAVYIPPAKVTARKHRKLPGPKESEILSAVMTYLRYHPAVAFIWRANTGAFMVGPDGAQRRIRAGFVGQSDVIGMLKDGRFLAIETKRPGGQLTADQHAFLSKVQRNGGVAFMAQSVDDVMRGLDKR